jgi:hypothetical protein
MWFNTTLEPTANILATGSLTQFHACSFPRRGSALVVGIMSQLPNTVNQSATSLLRVVAFVLSCLSAWFGLTAGMDILGHGFVNWLSDGNWFHHYWVSLIVVETFAILCICLLAVLRARIGWRATYKHMMTALTVLLLLPAQLSLISLPGAASVIIR